MGDSTAVPTGFQSGTALQTARLRDFQSLHYLRCGRTDGEFWAWSSNRAVSDDLARTLEQYESRGRLPFYEEESFDAQSWLAVLAGLERLPEMIDPASGIPPIGHEGAYRHSAS